MFTEQIHSIGTRHISIQYNKQTTPNKDQISFIIELIEINKPEIYQQHVHIIHASFSPKAQCMLCLNIYVIFMRTNTIPPNNLK